MCVFYAVFHGVVMKTIIISQCLVSKPTGYNVQLVSQPLEDSITCSLPVTVQTPHTSLIELTTL